MIVDDQPTQVDVLSEMLHSAMKVDVLKAQSREEALSKIEVARPNLVIKDIKMKVLMTLSYSPE